MKYDSWSDAVAATRKNPARIAYSIVALVIDVGVICALVWHGDQWIFLPYGFLSMTQWYLITSQLAKADHRGDYWQARAQTAETPEPGSQS